MKKKIILFDGVCNYCNRYVNFLIRADRRDVFRFAAFQSEEGKQICERLNISLQMQNDTFVLVEGEKFFTASTAALRLFLHLGGFYKIVYGLIVIPRPVRDFFYSIISHNRYRWFGKRDSCVIPDEKVRGKFVVEGD